MVPFHTAFALVFFIFYVFRFLHLFPTVRQNEIRFVREKFHEEDLTNPELSFNGPASKEIIKAWDDRFERMNMFREYTGENNFVKIKNEFLYCLTNKNHESRTIVKFIIAIKQNEKS